VLNQDGVVRGDIRSSFGASDTVAEGVPLTIELTVVDATAGCVPLAGAAVYAWHCDREGRYSMYSSGVENENYLRGVQETDDDGRAVFTSIFPAAYDGRWPHIHFEVYESVDAATSGGRRIATSQVAIPEAPCDAVYATDGYATSARNLDATSLEGDNAFGDDGAASQLGTVTGDVKRGFAVALRVPVDPSATSSSGSIGGGPGGVRPGA
jgi:protocatechuate 3,4-dioxygenase beta subunit